MRVFVLYDKSGIHSGRALGAHLIRKLSGKAQVSKGRPKRLEICLRRGSRYDYIINIGWFREFRTGGAKILNNPKVIATSSNKRKARELFKKNGVPAPKLWTNPNSVASRDLPVIGRTTHHAKGKGFWFCKSLGDVSRASRQGATHFLKYIPNTREFRVHVAANNPNVSNLKEDDYRVIKLSEKVPKVGARTNAVIKNHRNGWFFGYPKDKGGPTLQKVREIGKQTIQTLNLHWGAVDVIVSKDTGDAFVLEVNSTPCLTDDHANTMDKYSNALCVLLGMEPAPQKKIARPIANPEPTEEQRAAAAKTRMRKKLKRALKKQPRSRKKLKKRL